MTIAFSTYLNLFRLIAALLVFTHHAGYAQFDGGWIHPYSGIGHDAVIFFFVISGYVITHVAHERETTLSLFAGRRLSRLWSVALPALLLTFLFDAVGTHLAPDLYASLPGREHLEFLYAGLFLTQNWTLDISPGSNIPYWSLSYEFFFYALFACAMYVRPKWLVLLVAALAGPKILMLLPAWLAGWAAYHLGERQVGKAFAWGLALGGLALAAGVIAININVSHVGGPWMRLLEIENHRFLSDRSAQILTDNLSGLGIGLHLLGMKYLLDGVSLSGRSANAIRKAASATFPIYLIHYPALYFFSAISQSLVGHRIGLLISAASLVTGLALTPATNKILTLLRSLFGSFGKRFQLGSTLP